MISFHSCEETFVNYLQMWLNRLGITWLERIIVQSKQKKIQLFYLFGWKDSIFITISIAYSLHTWSTHYMSYEMKYTRLLCLNDYMLLNFRQIFIKLFKCVVETCKWCFVRLNIKTFSTYTISLITLQKISQNYRYIQ